MTAQWIKKTSFVTHHHLSPTRIGNIIAQFRHHHNLTQAELAGALKIGEDYVYKLETGQRLPSPDLLIRIAELFGLNPNWLKHEYLMDCLNVYEQSLKEELEIL